MNQDTEAEIKRKMLTTPFYQPLNGTYSLNGSDAAVQQLYKPSPSTAVNAQRNHNNGAFAAIDPEFRAQSAFDETVCIGKTRYCQLCGRPFLNSKHSHMYKDNNKCCVCKESFPTDAALKQHNDESLQAGKCCKPNCSIAIIADMEENKKHLDRHK